MDKNKNHKSEIIYVFWWLKFGFEVLSSCSRKIKTTELNLSGFILWINSVLWSSRGILRKIVSMWIFKECYISRYLVLLLLLCRRKLKNSNAEYGNQHAVKSVESESIAILRTLIVRWIEYCRWIPAGSRKWDADNRQS